MCSPSPRCAPCVVARVSVCRVSRMGPRCSQARSAAHSAIWLGCMVRCAAPSLRAPCTCTCTCTCTHVYNTRRRELTGSLAFHCLACGICRFISRTLVSLRLTVFVLLVLTEVRFGWIVGSTKPPESCECVHTSVPITSVVTSARTEQRKYHKVRPYAKTKGGSVRKNIY